MSSENVIALERKLYIYALVSSEEAKQHSSALNDTLGIDNKPVYFVPLNGFKTSTCAVVSQWHLKKIRPERKHLEAHRRVQSALTKTFSQMPVSFGIVADNETQIELLLKSSEEEISRELEKIQNCQEYVFKAEIKHSDVFAWLVSRSKALQEARDILIAAGTNAGRELKINVGRLVEAELHLVRETLKASFLSLANEKGIKDISERPFKQESTAIDVAFLVPRYLYSETEIALEKLCAENVEDFNFELNGPWPAHHFVNLRLNVPTAETNDSEEKGESIQ